MKLDARWALRVGADSEIVPPHPPNGSFTKLRAATARQRQRGAAVAAIQLEQRDAICNCRDAPRVEDARGASAPDQPRAARQLQ
jgi:hypothetical protein